MSRKLIVSIAVAALLPLALALPASAIVAGPATAVSAPSSVIEAAYGFCRPPRHMASVCVAWARGAPGTFAGRCVRRALRCVGPLPPIH